MRIFKTVLAMLLAVVCLGMTIDNPTITKIANLTTNGFVKTGSGNGTLSVDTNTYRTLLTADTTYYVRTDGNDSNTGLVNTAGGAFLTVQKALNVVSMIDFNNFNVTIQIADGTYTQALTLGFCLIGTGSLTIQGNTGTPTNVVLTNNTAANTFLLASHVAVNRTNLKAFKVANSSTGGGILAQNGSYFQVSQLDFGACGGTQLRVDSGASCQLNGNYTISGAAPIHYQVLFGGLINSITAITVTNTGTNNFSNAFAVAQYPATLRHFSATFTGGTITGKRYAVSLNGVIDTNGGGANYFPGNSAGTAATGGQYN